MSMVLPAPSSRKLATVKRMGLVGGLVNPKAVQGTPISRTVPAAVIPSEVAVATATGLKLWSRTREVVAPLWVWTRYSQRAASATLVSDRPASQSMPEPAVRSRSTAICTCSGPAVVPARLTRK